MEQSYPSARGQGRWGAEEQGISSVKNNLGVKVIQSHKELEVYQIAFESAMKIFRLSKKYPKEEQYLPCEIKNM